jgi:hypothetical protein
MIGFGEAHTFEIPRSGNLLGCSEERGAILMKHVNNTSSLVEAFEAAENDPDYQAAPSGGMWLSIKLPPLEKQ